jgi:DnaJ-class molecular chaperone
MAPLNTVRRQSHYEILGVSRKATPDEVGAAFLALARNCHPDVRPNDPQAVATFKRINEAHEVLSDPVRRQSYDEALDRRSPSRASRVQGQAPRRGSAIPPASAAVAAYGPADVRVELLLTPDEARRGGPCKFSVPLGRTTRKVQVNLPPRLTSRSVVCVVGAGKADARTGMRGNLYLHVRVGTGWDKPR